MQPTIIPRSDHPISRNNIDSDALKVLYRLYRSGHTAFLVGGGVRDLLIGRPPKDFDVCTSARPGQVKKLFRNCWLIGRRFRLAHVHFRDRKIIEVSTFRAQPEHENGATEGLLVRQDNTFGSPEEDALRRDFTINGLFYDIASFSLIDYVGGVEDIEAGVIRTIGDPRIRFQEDPVRMIRAIKFAARLDFAIEPQTWEALCEHAEELRKCSTSRVIEEISRLLEGGASCRSVQLLKASGLLRLVLPEVFEYIYGQPAGPGLVLDGRAEPPPTEEAMEEALLLNADEDVDREVQERILGVEGHTPPRPRAHSTAGRRVEPALDDLVAISAESDSPDTAPWTEPEPETEGEAEDTFETEEPRADVSETETFDEDAIDLSDEDEASPPDILTPQGTRCALTPDRGGLLWRMLSAVDERVRTGHALTRPTLYASLFFPIIHHTAEWMAASKMDGDDVELRAGPVETGMSESMGIGERATIQEVYTRAYESMFTALLRPLSATYLISRRDRERMCQIIAAQRKFTRRDRGFAPGFARKPYFAESLDLYEVSVLATGRGFGALEWWRLRYPYVPHSVVAGGRARLATEAATDTEMRGPRRTRRRRGARGGLIGPSASREERQGGGARPAGRSGRTHAGNRVEERAWDEGRARRVGTREGRGEDLQRRRGREETGRSFRDGREGSAPREQRTPHEGRARERTRYADEAYRTPRRPRRDAPDYYESRVGHDITPESPRPRRDDEQRRSVGRRRKPPPINR